MSAITVTPPRPGTPEFPVYAALKMKICKDLVNSEGSRLNGKWVFTARRLWRSLASDPDQGRVMDLYGRNIYHLRERLRKLNHGTIIELDGRGLRRAVQYAWREPIPRSTLHAFKQLRSGLGKDLPFALDVHAIIEEFGMGPFRAEEFMRTFQERLGGEGRASPRAAAPTDLARFLQARLKRLKRHGLVGSAPDGSLCLTRSGRTIGHWFELFVSAVDFPPDA